MSRWAVLVGPPGAGKTTVGAELANRWGVPFSDTDQIIEDQQHSTVSSIFIEHGEAFFRELEERAVAAVVGRAEGVIALGGGAVLSPRTREVLAGLPVVFLDVSLSASVNRVGLGVTRPLLLGNVRGRLKLLMDQRRPLYEEVARIVVPTDELTVEQVADQIEQRLS